MNDIDQLRLYNLEKQVKSLNETVSRLISSHTDLVELVREMNDVYHSYLKKS